MRSGLMGSSAWIASAVQPPINASRKRSSGKPVAKGWKVIIRIMAEMAASFTPSSPLPKNTATTIARATTVPLCTGPTPTTDTRRSPIATPKATPMVSSTTRLPRSPTASPSEMTAAIGANEGRSIPRISNAKNQATPAASAVCRICHHPPRRPSMPRRRRRRTRARRLPHPHRYERPLGPIGRRPPKTSRIARAEVTRDPKYPISSHKATRTPSVSAAPLALKDGER